MIVPIVGHSEVALSFDWNRLLAIIEKLDLWRRQMWRSNAFPDIWANERHSSPSIHLKTGSTLEICSKICGLSTCVEVENTSTAIFSVRCSTMLSVDEWTISVMMSKRATSITEFLGSRVRLHVSLTPSSVIGASFISKALLLARRLTVTNSVYFLLCMACCMVCRLFVHFAQLFAE